MADSLRDQLLKSGIVKQVREEKRQAPPQSGKPANKNSGAPRHGNNKPQGQRNPQQGKSSGEIDLAKAYAIRAQTEANERKRAEQAAAEQARIKREQKQKIQQLLQGQALNKADAEQVRHFEYGGKIRRVHVDDTQLAALNAGDLGVVQQGGRYLVVTRALAEQVRDIDAHQLALLADPNDGGVGEDGVPDDLMW
ncbi:DUF2058 family protein [Dyella subtropica]|uniref:DUF2058 family protein n=1 Tax=Dyella subtropica TaxID=2992127 RepID=UPI00225915A5|nr:DUF2058 family protein [Dyella subtropica]